MLTNGEEKLGFLMAVSFQYSFAGVSKNCRHYTEFAKVCHGLRPGETCLFPHLSVRDNILFGLKLRKISQQGCQTALEEIVSLLNISHLLHRKPQTLSGGEKQKVALEQRIAVLNQGRLMQIGTAEEIFHQPS